MAGLLCSRSILSLAFRSNQPERPRNTRAASYGLTVLMNVELSSSTATGHARDELDVPLGAYVLLFPRQRVTTLIPIFVFIAVREVPAVFLLGFWFVLQFFAGAATLGANAGEQGGVAYFAHIGGFVAGMVLIAVMGGRRPRLRRAREPYPPDRWY